MPDPIYTQQEILPGATIDVPIETAVDAINAWLSQFMCIDEIIELMDSKFSRPVTQLLVMAYGAGLLNQKGETKNGLQGNDGLG